MDRTGLESIVFSETSELVVAHVVDFLCAVNTIPAKIITVNNKK